MELKLTPLQQIASQVAGLLIVPYGIETQQTQHKVLTTQNF